MRHFVLGPMREVRCGCGRTRIIDATIVAPMPRTGDDLAVYHEAWRTIHTLETPSREHVLAALAPVVALRCACQPHAMHYIDSIDPLEVALRDGLAGYRRWTVRFHNHVNERLGKPQLTLEQAAAIWGW